MPILEPQLKGINWDSLPGLRLLVLNDVTGQGRRVEYHQSRPEAASDNVSGVEMLVEDTSLRMVVPNIDVSSMN